MLPLVFQHHLNHNKKISNLGKNTKGKTTDAEK